MKIVAEEYIDLFLKDMTDDKVIEAIDKLGLEQPVMDEQYEIDLDVSVLDSAKSGLNFIFEELKGYSQNGDLSLTQIEFHNKNKDIILPYNLSFNDNYVKCVEKIGKKAEFVHFIAEESYSWQFKHKEGVDYVLVINFKDEELNNISNLIIATLDPSEVGDSLLINEK